MGKIDIHSNELYPIWNAFIKYGELKINALDPFIAESWHRSREAGVNPLRSNSYISRSDKDATCPLPQELVSVAYPIIQEIYDSLRGTGFQVCLVDKNGYVIHSIAENGHNYGINWSERTVGTNAIGTAIVTGESIQVTGCEHYCYDFHHLVTTAAPIYDLQGNLLIVLALIGPITEDHTHTLTMLVKAAGKVIDNLKILANKTELRACNSLLTNLFSFMSDGAILLSFNGTIEFVNPAAEEIIGRYSKELINTPLQDILDLKQGSIKDLLNKRSSFTDIEVFIYGNNGKIHCLASGHVIKNTDGNIESCLLVLKKMNQTSSFVSRFPSTRAQYNYSDIIGNSPLLLESINIARMAALNNSHILLQGESGTGKEVFAQAIHNASFRHRGPFVAINCGAIPRELVGSELFGYVDGAFTGAKRGGSIGKFEMASGGTIFLDEIGDMPLELQVALLRVLQNLRITRIGDSKEIPVDVRVICATNKDLRSEIEKGNFREDLYYRLNVISIKIPPLRKRTTDIPLLTKHFLQQLASKNKNVLSILEPEIMDYLQRYNWPGNIRELRNVIERLVCLASHRSITISDLPPEIVSSRCSNPQSTTQITHVRHVHRHKKDQNWADKEYRQIIALLNKNNGNITKTAQEIGFSRMTLYRKMKLYNISRSDFGTNSF